MDMREIVRYCIPEVIVKAKAKSNYDESTIQRRLEVLGDRTDEEAATERAFLERAREKLKS